MALPTPDCGDDYHRSHDVWENMPYRDAQVRCTDAPSSLDVDIFFNFQHRTKVSNYRSGKPLQ